MQNFLKWLLLLICFAPVIIFACKQKKWYLILTSAFIGFLPDEFSIEISSKLPLLSADRILILMLMCFWMYDKWKKRNFSAPISILIYFGIEILISVANIHFGLMNEVKKIALLFFERIGLILMIIDLTDSREELDQCIDATVLSSMALSVIGIMQTILEYDITSVLHLVGSRSDMELTARMDMVRAFGTTNAIIYGCYCAFMCCVVFYRLEKTGKQRYSLALALNMIGLLCTLSRSAWLAAGAGVLLLFLIRPIKMMRRIWPALLMAVVLCISLFALNTNTAAAMTETAKSSINTVLKAVGMALPEHTPFQNETTLPPETQPQPTESIGTTEVTRPPVVTEPTVPTEVPATTVPEEKKEIFQFELDDRFGLNADSAANSRLVEWTAVPYMINEGYTWFGYGYSAFLRGKLHYFYPQFGDWTVAETLDVGLLKVVTEGGVVGLLNYLLLLGWLFVAAFLKRGKNGTFNYYKLIAYLIPVYLLLNFMAAFTGHFWLFVAFFYASRKLDKLGLPEDGTPAPDNLWKF